MVCHYGNPGFPFKLTVASLAIVFKEVASFVRKSFWERGLYDFTKIFSGEVELAADGENFSIAT